MNNYGYNFIVREKGTGWSKDFNVGDKKKIIKTFQVWAERKKQKTRIEEDIKGLFSILEDGKEYLYGYRQYTGHHPEMPRKGIFISKTIEW